MIQTKPLSSRITPLVQRQTLYDEEEEEEEEEVLQAKSNCSLSPQVTPGLESNLRSLRGSGYPLPETTRSFFEPRFGHDFGTVRIHADNNSDSLTTSLGARAFTVGKDIYFNKTHYQPENSSGKWLIAHELLHTIQQTGGRTYRKPSSSSVNKMSGRKNLLPQTSNIAEQIQPAWFTIGNVTVNVDFTGLAAIADADLVNVIEGRFIAFTSAADASAIHTGLSGLTATQRRWILYAVKLLQDNTQSPLHDRLNRTTAVQRLISHAPSAAYVFTGPLGLPEEEALRVSGWFEVALAAHLTSPTAADTSGISQTLNPPPAGGPGAALNVAQFHARMDPAVRHLLNQIDPNNWPSTGTRNLPTLQTIGDTLMTEAKDFFSPYAHTSRTTVFGLNPPFHISANIFSVTSLTPTPSLRSSYLRNRATIVGWNTSSSPYFSDRNIFTDVNFDSTRPADRTQFNILIANLLSNSTVSAIVDRLIRHTGRQSGTGAATTIGLSTEYDSSRSTRCQARWQVVDTLCHEIMHALAHPDFEAQTSSVGFGQVLLEGFPEVLGTQMFNQRVKPKAASNSVFKAQMEAGISPPPCPAPPNATIGYGSAGTGAENIRQRSSVGDDKFRAAFFLGQVHLIGL